MSDAPSRSIAYVSHGPSNDIHVFALDQQTGALEALQQIAVPGVAKTGNSLPFAVSPDRRYIQAAVRGEPLSAACFAIDPNSGRLAYRGAGPLAESLAYLSYDRTGRFLLGASYGGSMVSLNPVSADGPAGAVAQTLATEPKAHSAISSPDNRFIFAALLGGDAVLRLRFDAEAGVLSDPAAAARVAAGAGPRHLVFHPDGSALYLLNELDATLVRFDYDAASGELRETQTISILPPEFSGKPWAADIHITPDGRFLYASERTSSTLAVVALAPASGAMTLFSHQPTEAQPRAFAIDPTGRRLIAAGELSHHVSCYAIDQRTGALVLTARAAAGRGPTWVEIVSLP